MKDKGQIAKFLVYLGLIVTFQSANASSSELVDKYYETLTKMGQFSGSVMYFQSGKLRFAKYYGKYNLKKDYPAQGDFYFRIGSLSKTVASAAILSLVDQKKITLDTSANKIISDLEIPDAVTIRTLLNHTSGAIYEFGREVKTERDFRTSLKKMHWEAPGKYVYSNIGYQLLGLILKKITGESLESYERTKIFSKLKSKPIHFSSERTVPNLVSGIDNKCGKFSVIEHVAEYDIGSGDVIGTPMAIADFFLALNNNKIISKESKQMMLNDSKHLGYGFGMEVKEVDNKRIFGHNGSIPGFKSFVRFNEQADFFIVFSNVEQFPVVKAEKDAALLLAGKEFELPAPIDRKEVTIAPAELMEFVGDYVLDFDANQKLSISFDKSDGHFYILDTGENKKLLPDSKNTFFTCATSSDSILFKKDGKKSYLELTGYGGAKFTASRIQK